MALIQNKQMAPNKINPRATRARIQNIIQNGKQQGLQ